MSGFYVGQKVRVNKNFSSPSARNGGYNKGDVLVVSCVDSNGNPSFVGDEFQETGWGDHNWFTPIDTHKLEIELTQIRLSGRLYNLVPVEK